MEQVTYVRERRSDFALLVAIFFWGFHFFALLAFALVLAQLFGGSYSSGSSYGSAADGALLGRVMAGTIALSWVGGIWVAGTIIFGSMMAFTQPPVRRVVTGSKENSEAAKQDADPLMDRAFKPAGRSG